MISPSATFGRVSVHDLIGKKLREFYEDVAGEPVPDRFNDLLDKLESEPPEKKPT